MNNYCALPWNSLEAMPTGQIRPCCFYVTPLRDYNLKNNTLTEAFFSEEMNNLRQEFSDGLKPAGCIKCWTLENAGSKSKRQYSNEIFFKRENKLPKLEFLDLKLGNLCNLKCRICGSWSSSQWASENIKNNIKIDENKKLLEICRWPVFNKQFWDDLETLLPNITYIEFTGGEPFMIQEHFDLLKKIIEYGFSQNIKIHYNTNGTVYPEEALQTIYSYFKEVEIAFSIDDIGERFNYQRSPADWEKVQNNIAAIQKFKFIKTQICCTVSLFNVYYLEEVSAWINSQTFHYNFYNLIHGPEEFCITNIPKRAKHAIIDKWKSGNFSDVHRRELNNLINFMEIEKEDNPEFINLAKERIKKTDNIRKTSFKKTHNEMWKLLYNE